MSYGRDGFDRCNSGSEILELGYAVKGRRGPSRTVLDSVEMMEETRREAGTGLTGNMMKRVRTGHIEHRSRRGHVLVRQANGFRNEGQEQVRFASAK